MIFHPIRFYCPICNEEVKPTEVYINTLLELHLTGKCCDNNLSVTLGYDDLQKSCHELDQTDGKVN